MFVHAPYSTAYWPIVWPSNGKACLRIISGASTIDLPVRRPVAGDAELRAFEEPDSATGVSAKRIRYHQFSRKLGIDLATNRFRYELNGAEFDDASLVYFEDIDLRIGHTLSKCFEIREDDPLSATEIITQRATLTRGGWRVVVRMSMTQTCDAESFYLRGRLEADEGDSRFHERDFDVSVPRRLV